MENKKMGRRKGIVILIAVCVGAIIFSALGLSNYFNVKEDQLYKISVIVYGTEEERWNNLKEGIDQAVLDYSIDVNFVPMYEEGGVEDQELLLQREIENGAQAIAIAAYDSKGMEEAIESVSRKVPVIVLENTTNMGENTAKIGADNGKIGEELGKKISQDLEEQSKIAIIYENIERESISQRCKELKKVFVKKGDSLLFWTRGDGDFSSSVFLQKKLEDNKVDAIVALDDINLENAIDAIKASGSDVKLYGVGNTEKSVHYLDEGIVEALVFVNEYNMGYLSMKSLVENLRNNTALYNQEIEYSIVNKEDLYEKENQRLMFPIVE